MVSARTRLGSRTWSSTSACTRGGAVGQEDVGAVAEALGQHRVEGAEDVEMDFKRVAGVHVLVIAALPAESLARLGYQARRVDCRAGEKRRRCSSGKSSPTTPTRRGFVKKLAA